MRIGYFHFGVVGAQLADVASVWICSILPNAGYGIRSLVPEKTYQRDLIMKPRINGRAGGDRLNGWHYSGVHKAGP